MNNNINLLPSKNNKRKSEEKLVKIFQGISVIFLVITALSAIILFFLNLNPELSHILQKKNNALTNLSFTDRKIAKYLLIKDRVGTIDRIIHTRYSFDDIIVVLRQQVPSDVTIDSMSLDSKVLAISLSSPSLSSLDTFLTNTTGLLQNKKVIKSMTIDDITSDTSIGKYTLTVKSDLL